MIKLIFSCHLKLMQGVFILLVLFAWNNSIADGVIGTEPAKLDVSTFPPIEEDIRALAQYDNSARVAGLRLIERGNEILTAAHGALADPAATFEQRMQLLAVLGEIGDVSSIPEIINNIENAPNNRYLYQNALLALSNFEPTEEINKFVNKQLEITKRDPLLQRNALNYYAKQPHEDATQWIEKYALNKDANPEVRYTALYMAGMNGVEVVKEPIAELLDNTTNVIREYYLLLGFANVATMEEFNALVKDKNLNLDNVNKVKAFLKFRLANPEEKKNLAEEYLNTNNSQLKQAVVKHLIKEKDADALASNWQQGDGAVRAAIKRAGFTINVDEHGAELIKTPNNKVFPLWLYLLVFAAIAAFAFLILRKKMNNT